MLALLWASAIQLGPLQVEVSLDVAVAPICLKTDTEAMLDYRCGGGQGHWVAAAAGN